MTEPSHLDTTRRAYDAVAVDYAALLRTSLAESPLDRALLNVLAELVLADGGGMVGDLGCGPGRVTAYLHERGLDAFGVDLSPGMVAVAARATRTCASRWARSTTSTSRTGRWPGPSSGTP
jgi:SAM-dependent methyltransferase